MDSLIVLRRSIKKSTPKIKETPPKTNKPEPKTTRNAIVNQAEVSPISFVKLYKEVCNIEESVLRPKSADIRRGRRAKKTGEHFKSTSAEGLRRCKKCKGFIAEVMQEIDYGVPPKY